MKSRILLLILGLLLGLVAALVAPRFWQRVAPPVIRGEATVGVVESKGWDDRRLLMTLVTDSGAILATFRRRAAEIDLLVAEGDTVALRMRGYRPFVQDPVIDRVVKWSPEEAEEPAPAPAEAPTEADAPAAAEPEPAPPDEASEVGLEEPPAETG